MNTGRHAGGMNGQLAADERDAPPRDEATVTYFDEHTPEYDVDRLRRAAAAIGRRAKPTSSLIDLGCGTGNTLKFLIDRTGIRDVAGVDVSARCLARTREQVQCAVHQGSILDRRFVSGIGRQFDFAVLGAILHHLIGRTRAESKAYAQAAVANSLGLLRPGGFLIVVEPVWYPSVAMDCLFYVKKLLTALTTHRVQIFGEWNNIGPPVVSYYTNEQLADMITCDSRVVLREKYVDRQRLPRALSPFLHRTETTIVAEMSGDGLLGNAR